MENLPRVALVATGMGGYMPVTVGDEKWNSPSDIIGEHRPGALLQNDYPTKTKPKVRPRPTPQPKYLIRAKTTPNTKTTIATATETATAELPAPGKRRLASVALLHHGLPAKHDVLRCGVSGCPFCRLGEHALVHATGVVHQEADHRYARILCQEAGRNANIIEPISVYCQHLW